MYLLDLLGYHLYYIGLFFVISFPYIKKDVCSPVDLKLLNDLCS